MERWYRHYGIGTSEPAQNWRWRLGHRAATRALPKPVLGLSLEAVNGRLVNPDTSVDVYFGPKAPERKESNWLQTVPGRGWFIILRLYGALEAWFDKTWKPGEIEAVK